MPTFMIPANNIAALKSKLDKMCAKASKIGADPISYKVGELVSKYVVQDKLSGSFAMHDTCVSDDCKMISFHPVEVSGQAPTVNGWTFVATIQHFKGEDGQPMNILKVHKDFETKLPTHFRTADSSNCDHCHKKIMNRKDTYVVRHENGEDWKQVGKTCLSDFLGGKSPAAIAASLDIVLALESTCSEYTLDSDGFSGFSAGDYGWPIRAFLASTVASISKNGWVSRSKARENDSIATADRVLGSKDIKWTDVDASKADAALEYIRDTLSMRNDLYSDLNDYEHNLLVACTQSVVTKKTAGIVASAIVFHDRILSDAAKAADSKSEHFGTIGARENFYLTYLGNTPGSGNYGPYWLCRFSTKRGCEATWFATSAPDMEVGKEYLINATIKGHSTFKGIKQTALSRVKVYSDAERAKAEAKWAKAKKQ